MKKFSEEEKNIFRVIDEEQLFEKIVNTPEDLPKTRLKCKTIEGVTYVLVKQFINGDMLVASHNVVKIIKEVKHSPTKINEPGGLEYKNNLRSNWGKLGFEQFPNVFKIKVIGSDISGKFFGKATAKKNMIGKSFDSYEIVYIRQKYLQDLTLCARIIINGEIFSFAIADIEFIFPSLKGYTFPKDLSFREGQEVIARNRPGKYTILSNIYRSSVSKKVSRRSQDRRRDVFSCTDGSKLYHFYAEDLKHV